mmetsp:Transcript_56479/g.104578  ORF Transcript_56479/g.104578 Transcript_56479/m.104578 type:complete len:448 (-) Transcript_56479:156-1499(-)
MAEINVVSTSFILVSTALVQLMTPGLAFFYGGLVSDTSVVTMMMQVFVSMGITSIMWFVFLFSLCFGETWDFFGNPGTYFFLKDVRSNEPLNSGMDIPGLLFMAYQGMFAVITPVLMTGAFADRFRFKAFLIFLPLWMVLVYAPFCHWVWGGGWMAEWGVWDFAGGIVVHITAGFSALGSLVVVGKRKDADDTPHNIPFVALGTALLWFGWFGFNGGSALNVSGASVAAAVNSEIAASVALFMWLIIDWLRLGRPKLVGLCVGAIAGLATVTPAAGFIQPWAAFALGAVACVVCYLCCEARKFLHLDDALDVWGVHGMGGFVGSCLLGALADPSECNDGDAAPGWCVNPNTVTRSWEQLGMQCTASVICAAYSFVATVVLLKLINLVVPIVPSNMQELDLQEHGEAAYTPTKAYIPTLQQKEKPAVHSPLKETSPPGSDEGPQNAEV